MPDFNVNAENISIGPLHLKIYSEDMGGCFYTGCLTTARFAASKNMQPVVCNVLDGPITYRMLEPGMSIGYSTKELSATNFAIGAGGTSGITTPTIGDRTEGTIGANSTVASPAEWHIVKLPTGGAPWTFTMYLENRDVCTAAGANSGFVLNTDISIYLASPTNGDAAVAVSAAFTIDETSAYDANSFRVSDPCMGKISFEAVADATIAQYTYDASSAPFTINGVYPIVENDVNHGDTVALIGFSYIWGRAVDAAAVLVPFPSRQLIQFDNNQPTPVSIKGIHFMQQDQTHFALIFRLWKAYNMTGFGTAFDSMSAADITIDTMFQAINDKRNHPNSPFGELEIIRSATALDLENLL